MVTPKKRSRGLRLGSSLKEEKKRIFYDKVTTMSPVRLDDNLMPSLRQPNTTVYTRFPRFLEPLVNGFLTTS